MRLPLSFAFAVILAAPTGAFATTLISQDRSIYADAHVVDHFGTVVFDSEGYSAPDFGPFDRTADAGAGFAGGFSSQLSTLTLHPSGALDVEATGGMSASAFNMFLEPVAGGASGRSEFEVTFVLDASMSYELSARVAGSTVTDPFPASWGREWSASVELVDGVGGVVAQLARSSALEDPPGQIDVTQLFFGTLSAGTYTLRATSEGLAFGDQYFPDYAFASSAYTLDFALAPEPGGVLLLGLAFAALSRRWRR